MLRAENVPHPLPDCLLERLALEFSSDAMKFVVQEALEKHNTDNLSLVDAETIAAAVLEWKDSPWCAAIVVDEKLPLSATASPRWASTTQTPSVFHPMTLDECSFECGKRLNRIVAALLRHNDLDNECMSFFTGPEETTIVINKLHGYNERYHGHLSRATDWFAKADVAGSFVALSRGVFVLGLTMEAVERAMGIVNAVVERHLAPSIAWLFECERAPLPLLARGEISIVASSNDELETLMNMHGSNVRAVMLGFGPGEHDTKRTVSCCNRSSGSCA